MQFHPIADLFRMLPEADLQAMAEDIRTQGQLNDIIVFQKKILDGRNRWKACEMAGVKPRTREFTGSKSEAIAFVWSENFHRRHLSSGAAAMAVAERKKMDPDFVKEVVEPIQAEAKEAQRKSKGRGKKGAKSISQVKRGDCAADKIAKIHGTNRVTVSKCEKILDEHPELAEEIKSGVKSVTQAEREIKENNREARREANRSKVAKVASPEAAVGDAKFATIVIDPPWDWGDEGDVNQLGRAKPDYSTMSIEQLMELPVGTLADEDCHLYLWITNRSLPKGFALIERWGFRYITAITWVKPHYGMGNYFRGQTEHLLFAVKGSQPLKRKDIGTVFHAPRGTGHSAKPVQIYELIESASPGPYIEMFSRCNRSDWVSWGEDSGN